MGRFSELAFNNLRKAGWYEGRTVAFESIRSALIDGRFEVFPSIERFLTEFHGIQIAYSRPDSKSIGSIRFNVLDLLEIQNIFDIVDEKYRSMIGIPLCILGEIDQDMLLMDSGGKVYSVLWPYISQVGESGDDFLEKVFSTGSQYGILIHPK